MTLTTENIVDYIIEMAKVLDEADTPPNDRWIILHQYKPPRSRKWRIRKKRMKAAWFGLSKRSMMRRP
jgi:hypothetical protein